MNNDGVCSSELQRALPINARTDSATSRWSATLTLADQVSVARYPPGIGGNGIDSHDERIIL
jgi:hypothetical protein